MPKHVWALALLYTKYNKKITEQVTGLQLLGELLLERSNLKVMVRYVADEGNLKLMMNLLRDSSRSIQFEAFHVFKVLNAHSVLCHVSLPHTSVMHMSNIAITGDWVQCNQGNTCTHARK